MVSGQPTSAIIAINTTVTMDVANATVNSLTLNSGATAAVVTISGSNSLTVTGATTINGPTAGVNTKIAINAGTFIANGLITINGGGAGTRNAQLTLDTGVLTIGNGMTFAGTLAQAQFINTSWRPTINLQGGTISGAAGTFTVLAGTTLNATGGTIGGAYTFGILGVPSGGTLSLSNFAITFAGVTSDSGTINTVTGLGAYVFTGAVTINSGGVFDMSGQNPTLNFKNGITMNGATFNSGTAATTFNTNAQTLAGTSNMTFSGGVTVAAAGPITNNNTGTTVTINSILSLNTGSWTQGTNSNLVLANTTPMNGAGSFVLNSNPNNITYTGSGAATTQTSFYNVAYQPSGAGAQTLPAGTINIAGNMTVGNGTNAGATGNGNTILNVTGNLTINTGRYDIYRWQR